MGGGKTLPEQYHNGGIWPFVGGFYVAALVKAGQHDRAARVLEKLAEVNRLGIEEEWEFNESCTLRSACSTRLAGSSLT